MRSVVLRRVSIFVAVAGLGITLAWLLAARGGRARGPGARLPVVDVPQGASFQGVRGIPGIVLVESVGTVVAPIQDLVLEDGSRVPFRALVLKCASQAPLPSTAPGVRRATLKDPILRMLPVPRTRAELAASAGAVPTAFTAPEGILESGPGETLRLELRGGVTVEAVREGTPWTFRAPRAFADLDAKTVRAPGAVSLSSKEIEAEGIDMEVQEQGHVLALSGGAKGTVKEARGVRFAGGGPEGDTRFRCTGPLRLEAIPPAPGVPAAERPESWRLVLQTEAIVEQDRGSLAADRIEGILRRARGGGDTVLEEVRAQGKVVLSGGDDARAFRATGGRFVARPAKDGSTEAFLEEKPAVALREASEGREVRSVEASGSGTARFTLPAREGPVSILFRGGGTAAVTEPAEKEGAAARRREIRAKTLRVDAHRDADGRTEVRGVDARESAEALEGDRRALADRIAWAPREGGGSRTGLEGNVSVTWPAAGVLDPLAAREVDAGAPAPEAGSLLLSTPGRAVLDLPPDSPDAGGAAFAVEGGTVIRRVAGEREVWRLSCAKCEGTLRAGSRELDALLATGDVRLAGREERAGGRTYDLRGESLEVRGAAGTREPRTALLRGAPGKPPSASFTGEDGRPITVAAETLRMDREKGAIRAEGAVRATGVLPEESSQKLASKGGKVELSCGVLEARFAEGGAEGTTRLLGLEAREDVRVATSEESAVGDTLVHDAEKGTIELRGDPARVVARVDAPAGMGILEDLSEAEVLFLTFRDGTLLEARAPEGGRFVSHRVPQAAPGEPAPAAERYEARTEGALTHGPSETVLAGPVTLDHSVAVAGEFKLRDRVEGADEIRILHPPAAPGKAGRVERAVASSRGGRIEIEALGGEWRAIGVSSASFEAATDCVVLEAGKGTPRFRVEGRDGVNSGRRVVYDYRAGVFREWMGMSIEGQR